MKKLLCVISLMLALVCALASCQGEQGLQGEKGEQGIQGEKGDKGDKGDEGLTPTIEISDDGYWVINGEKTDVKAKGEDGKDAVADNENPQGLTFYLKDDDTYAVAIGNACRLSKIVIPERYNGKIVNEIIEYGFFAGSQSILPTFTKILLPKSITIIGDYSFSGCENLTSIFYEGSLEEWKQIEISSSNNDSFKNAIIYYDCDLQNLSLSTISDDVAISILEEAFENSRRQGYWCAQILNDGVITSACDKNTASSEFENLLFNIHNDQSPLINISLGFAGEDLDLYEFGDKTVFAMKNCPDGLRSLAVSIENGLVRSFVMIGRSVHGQILYYYEPVDIPPDVPLPEPPSQKVDISGFTKLSDFNGSNAVIGAQTGTFHLDALISQTDGVTVKDFPDFNLLLTTLRAGAIDGFVAEEITAISLVAQDEGLAYVPLKNNSTGFTASDSDTGIAVAFKTGSDMVAKVNAILANISTATRESLMQQVVSMSTNKDAALGAELALASTKTDTSNGTLRIAMECAYDPFNWTQVTDANGAVKINGTDFYANGYDVQIAKYIAAELGMALEIHVVGWNSLIPGLQAGVYDAIIAGMSPTAEREEIVDFTDCYYNANLVIIYKKS